MKTNGLHLAVVALLAAAPILTAQPTLEWEVDYGDQDLNERGLWATEARDSSHVLIGRHGWENDLQLLNVSMAGDFVEAYHYPEYSYGTFVELDPHGGFLFGTHDSIFARSIPGLGVLWAIVVPAESRQIHASSTGGYFVGGHISISPFDSDPWIGRYDQAGNEIWTTIVPLDGYNPCYEAEEMPDGSIIMATSSASTVYLLRFSGEGDFEVLPSFETFGSSYAEGIQVRYDGGLMLYGWFELEENDLFGLITTDGSGILQSQMSTGSWGTNSAIQLADGGYLGIFSDIYSSADTTVVHRFNAAGDLLWVLDYQYQPGHATGGETLYAVGDSAFVIGGTWEPEEGFSDTNMFLTKFLLPPTDFEVEVESYRQPLIVDPPDAFYWHGTLTNNTDEPATRDVWVVARGPDGSLSEPYALWEEIDVPAQGSVEADIRQLVPQSAPPGEYNYIVRAGDYPTHRIQDHLALTVTGDAQPEIPDAAGGGTTVPWFEKPARVGDVQR